MENDLCATNSSCKELDEEDFQEGEYTTNEMGSFEELWPEECLHTLDTYNKSNYMKEGKRKKKR